MPTSEVVHISDLIEDMIKPAIIGLGFHPDLVDEYIGGNNA
jgi:hypothetical protein